MRSDAEIRRQVENHLKRRGLFVVDAGLWLMTVFAFWQDIFPYSAFARFQGLVVIFMLLWTGVLGLHFLRTAYVELREWLINRAIERERRYYVVPNYRDEYVTKPKRDAHLGYDAPSRLALDEDGELVEFDYSDDEDAYATPAKPNQDRSL